MTKQEFVGQLRERLSALPLEDVEARIGFYSEAIDDRIEEGFSEEQAVMDVGDVKRVAEQIISETPLAKIVKEKIKPKRKLGVWETVFLILGSPLWLSLLIAAFAVALSLYLTVWSVIVALWAVFGALVGCALGLTVGGVILIALGNGLWGVATFGCGLASGGFSIFAFYGCLAATKGTVSLAKNCLAGIKRSFFKKETKK